MEFLNLRDLFGILEHSNASRFSNHSVSGFSNIDRPLQTVCTRTTRYPRALIACPIQGSPTRSFNSRSTAAGAECIDDIGRTRERDGGETPQLRVGREVEVQEDNGRGGIITCVTGCTIDSHTLVQEYNLPRESARSLSGFSGQSGFQNV